MITLANGLPKSGTHALVGFLQGVGLRRAPGLVKRSGTPSGLRFIDRADGNAQMDLAAYIAAGGFRGYDFVHAHIPFGPIPEGVRVITVIRDPRNVLLSYIRYRPEPLTMEDAIRDFYGGPFVEKYRAFLDWREHCQVIRYEGFVSANRATGVTDTWTGQPSNWKKAWTPAIDELWNRVEGPKLLKDAGYA